MSNMCHFFAFCFGQMTLQGLKEEEHDIFVVATCDFMCLEALLRMQCSRSMGMVKIPCKSQVW